MAKLNKTETRIMNDQRRWFGDKYTAESSVHRREFNACLSLAKKGLVDIVFMETHTYMTNSRRRTGDYARVTSTIVKIKKRG